MSNSHSRLRVCHVITGFDTGGTERALLKTVKGLDPVRYESLIVSLRGRGPLSDEIERAGFETFHLGMGKRPGPITLWRLARLFRRKRVQIVHSYLYDACIASRMAGRVAGVPVVITSTRAPLDYLPRMAWWLDRATARWCRRIIAVSEHTADFIVRREGIDAGKVVIVRNGVDLQRFRPGDRVAARETWSVPQGSFVVAVVGRLSREKGHPDLFAALASMRTTVPSTVCLLAGAGPLRAKYERQVHSMGLGGICRFLGDVRAVESVFNAADVTVLPSMYEGMPNAILEATACGCPVVATAVGGSVEVVRDGETGFLVPPSDSEALARALTALARSPGQRAQMRTRSREVAEDSYGIGNMIRSLERLYEKEWQASDADLMNELASSHREGRRSN